VGAEDTQALQAHPRRVPQSSMQGGVRDAHLEASEDRDARRWIHGEGAPRGCLGAEITRLLLSLLYRWSRVYRTWVFLRRLNQVTHK
jgi:hypothetical protein